MNKAKLVVLIMTIMLLITGVAYARWTERVSILVLAKTAETELTYIDYTSRTESGKVSVTKGEATQATVVVKEMEPGTSNSVTLSLKNTGTIPIAINDIKVLYVCGYSEEHKNDIWLTVSAYVGEERIFQQNDKIFHWRVNHSGSKRDELYELPVNGSLDIICKIEFNEIKGKDNPGHNQKGEQNHEIESSVIKENVSFVIEVECSGFQRNS